MSRNRLVALAAAVLVLSACGKDATAPATGSRLTSDEAQALALNMAASGDAYAGAVPSASLVGTQSAGTPFGPITFTKEHACPKGGSVLPDITIQGTVDLTAHSLTVEMSGTETPRDCSYPVKATTITVSGNPNLAVAGHVSIVAGVPSGAQTFTQKGGFTWKSSDGRSGTCTVDLTSSADFSKDLRTVAGTFCGQTISISGPLH